MAIADSNTHARPEITIQSPVIAERLATLLKKPQGGAMDLFQSLDICQQYVDELIEINNHTEYMALCGRLLAGLEVLKSVLNMPLPEYLIEQLTVNNAEHDNYRIPLSTDSETLRQYCSALTLVLLNQQETPEQQEQIQGMLFEMMNTLVEDLKAPRFMRTDSGLVMISGGGAASVH